MTESEKLLNSLSLDDISLYTTDPENEEHIIIDSQRNIIVPDSLKRIAVQRDNKIENVVFDCPRYWDDNDLMSMYIYINYLRRDGIAGLNLAKNLRVDENDNNMIHFDWEIRDELSIVDGELKFGVSAKKTIYETQEEIRWYSEINEDVFISEGLDSSEDVVNAYPDVINDLLTKMDAIVIPEKGKNYFTEADKEEIINEVKTGSVNSFDTHAADKSTEFDTHAADKTTEFDTHVSDKTTEFDTHAADKTTEFDTHVSDKTTEFDTHAENIISSVDKLSSIIPQKTTSGTNTLEYDKAKAYNLFNGEYEGKEYQKSTTGKNLANINNFVNIDNAYKKLTIANDKITITNNVSEIGYAATEKKLSDICPDLKVDDIAYLFFNTTSTSTNKNILFLTEPARTTWNNGEGITITQNILDGNIIFYGGYNETAVISNFMITKENDDTYEPFTNGPSPNPEYQQEVKTLKGWNLANIYGFSAKGLLSISNTRTLTNNSGTTISSIDNVKELIITQSTTTTTGITSADNGYFIIGVEGLVNNTQYTLTADIDITNNPLNNNILQIMVNGNSSQNPKTITNNKIIYPFIYKDRDDRKYLEIRLSGKSIKIRNIQIVEGTEEKPYLPYGSIGIKRHGKNFFDKYNYSSGLINYLSGSNWESDIYRTSDFIKVIKNTKYTISCKFGSQIKPIFRDYCVFFDKNKNYVKQQNFTMLSGDNIGYFTASDDGYIKFSYYADETKTNEHMVEVGSTATSFEPYIERIDYIDLKGNEVLSKDKIVVDIKGNVKLIKNWKKYIFTGLETNISMSSELYNNLHYSVYRPNDIKRVISSDDNFFNNQYKFVDSPNRATIGTGYCITNQFLMFDKFTTLEEFKQDLKNRYDNGKPVILYYELNEPQVFDLGTIEPIESLDGINYVEILATLEPTSMSETYAYDLQKVVESLMEAQ